MAHPRVLQFANLLQPCIKNKALLSGKAIHAQIFACGFSLDTFLSNRLVELYSQCNQFDYALNSFYSILNPNIFSWNAILSSASKSGNIDLAQQLFDQMPEKNVVSWNTMISVLARRGPEEKALNLHHEMIQQGLMPTHFTFASVLSACASLMDLVGGTKCHGVIVKVGLDSHLFVENALLSLYTKCGILDDAVRLFDGMARPNEVSFTAIIGGLVQSGCIAEALRLFARMHKNGVLIDQVAVSSVLGACARTEDESYCLDELSFSYSVGQAIHAIVLKHGFESESHVGNSLMDMYAKHGDMEKADFIFKTLPAINVVSWNVIIAGYGKNGDADRAVDMWKLMQESQFEPDEVTYISMLSACVKSGDTETARKMFDKIKSPSVASYNAILSGYCQNEDHQEAIELFREMKFSNLEPNRTTLAIILSSCSGMGVFELGKQVHGAAMRVILHEDMFVSSGLVDMYSKCGDIEAARKVFDRMKDRDVVSWNSMITGFAHHSLNREAFSFFKMMREDGLSPTESSYASTINSCARLCSLPQGRQAHAQVIKDGHDCDFYVGSSIIDMYGKCGVVTEARLFFDGMPSKNIVSWNEMIHGYAQNGYGEEAIELFEYMLDTKEKPDSVTFVAVLTACSHSGFVDKGIRFFNSMKVEYDIEPLADHYTCILDTLGRAGCLRDTKLLLDKMPYKDDPIVWEVVLSACVVHGDASLGRRAAEELFRIDPKNSAPYVLLANMYASAGKWAHAAAVRKLMSDRGVVKDRGYSWINNKNGVQAFMVDDCLDLVGGNGRKLNGDAPSHEICAA
ncbi:pentatricopeptide repeat-containing protein At4g20770 [Phalaenopsis equestris]|uniref:pentatricopeptide repeat-containing protein At4g20770 n=1 Tax=Phalaenopsis equestris TaxID=78828 RepID=UPI0009E4C79B|nr:pentatricopeptide repeat-containing protein At4g20770 [Phalaenopsis equestris]